MLGDPPGDVGAARGDRQEDLVRLVLLDDALEVVDPALDDDVVQRPLPPAVVVVDDRDRPEAQVVVVLHLADDLTAGASGTHHDDAQARTPRR